MAGRYSEIVSGVDEAACSFVAPWAASCGMELLCGAKGMTISLLTAVALVTLATAIIVYLVVVFSGWADRRESRRRNHAHPYRYGR